MKNVWTKTEDADMDVSGRIFVVSWEKVEVWGFWQVKAEEWEKQNQESNLGHCGESVASLPQGQWSVKAGSKTVQSRDADKGVNMAGG